MTGPSTERTLHAILDRRAREMCDEIFLMAGDERQSYAEVNRAVNAIANGLIALGLGQGDRVAIVMGSRPDYVRLVLAVNRIGAIWVPLNPDYRGEWLAEAINDSCPAALVIEDLYAHNVAAVRDKINVRRTVVLGDIGLLAGDAVAFADLERAASTPPPPVLVAEGDTAAILWTSGTTGKPKGVMQSHSTWINACEASNRNYRSRPGDVAYSCLPLYNSAAWVSSILRALVGGIAVAIDPNFSVSDFWNRIRYYGATQTMSLGAMHMFLFNAPEQPDDADNPLRVAALTPLPEHIVTPFCRRFGLELVLQGYGQSEVMTLLQRSYVPDGPDRNNALGDVCPDFELKLLDDDGNEVPTGTPGEFAVRELRPHALFNGYFNNPQANAESFRGDWFCTGDLGIKDANGDYYFVDRKKDYIRYKGRSISSFQVERVASKFPGVAECAAYGIPSQALASEAEIKLDVVAAAGAEIDPAAVARFINDNAPHFIVPRYIEIVASLPHTPTNKVEKYKLRERGLTPKAWDRLASDFELAR